MSEKNYNIQNAQEEQELYDVGGGRCFPVIGYIQADESKGNIGCNVPKGTPGAVPLVDIKMMSDFKWQYGCLMSRLEHPEHYKDIDINVSAVIKKLKQWLLEHIECADELGEEKKNELFRILEIKKEV